MSEEHSPLLTNALLWKLLGVLGLLALLSVGLSVAGAYYGDWLKQDGQTDSRAPVDITLGQDRLRVPANMIRFPQQRRSGEAESINVYLTWPEMQGYSRETAERFTSPDQFEKLIFMEFSQSVMSRDMSGRLEPIYSKLFQGAAQPGPAGLALHHLDPKAGYGDEVLLTAPMSPDEDYVVRCLLPAPGAKPSSSDCQRDIHVGRDLTLLYRFSSALLPEWKKLDGAIRAFAEAHLNH